MPKRFRPTERDRAFLKALTTLQAEKPWLPKWTEIAAEAQIHAGTVQDCAVRLKKNGFISYEPRDHRTTHILPEGRAYLEAQP